MQLDIRNRMYCNTTFYTSTNDHKELKNYKAINEKKSFKSFRPRGNFRKIRSYRVLRQETSKNGNLLVALKALFVQQCCF